jgi:threonine dehydrogenase-like Zn-dependent dehydrogenase
VQLENRPDPVAGPDDVVVAVHSCGICGSDVHAAQRGGARNGGVPGHEFAGTIATLGSNAGGWSVGQPVAVNPLAGCGNCEWCRREMPILCPNAPNIGLGAPGGFAEFVAVPQRQLHALPESLPVELGSRAEPLAVGLRAVTEAHPAPGDNAIVFGVGPIGLNVIMALRAASAGHIIAVGRSSAARRTAAQTLGADAVLDSRETDVADYVQQTGLDIAYAYECSGDPQALVTLGRAVRPGGALIGVALNWSLASIDMHRFVSRGLRLIGACAYGQRDFGRAVDLIVDQKVDVGQTISARVGLEEAPRMFARLQQPGDLVSVLVQPWRRHSD